MQKQKIFALIPFVILFLLLFLSILAPYLEYKRIAISQDIYKIFRHICNQMPTHCFWIFGSNMALCARCFCIYLSLFITGIVLLLYPKFRNFKKKNSLGFVLSIPMVIDGLSQFWGMHESNNFYRAITGILAGIGLGLIFFPAYWRLIKLK